MRDIRIHHHEPIDDDSEVRLGDAARHHVGRVLRLGAGDPLVLFDGSGHEWPAVVVDARAGTVRVTQAVMRDRESPLRLSLVQGVARGDRMDWTIQKAVELGVSRIEPVLTERSSVKLDAARAAKRSAHWRGIVVAACEQCGRTRVPEVLSPCTYDEALARGDGTLLAMDPAATATLGDLPDARGTHWRVLVGPEGGLSDAELAAADAAGCLRVRLGPRTLRTETAGIAALSALQTLYGDLSA